MASPARATAWFRTQTAPTRLREPSAQLRARQHGAKTKCAGASLGSKTQRDPRATIISPAMQPLAELGSHGGLETQGCFPPVDYLLHRISWFLLKMRVQAPLLEGELARFLFPPCVCPHGGRCCLGLSQCPG